MGSTQSTWGSSPTMKFLLLTCSLLLFLASTTEGGSNSKFDTEKKDVYDPLGLLGPQPIPGLQVLKRTMRATRNNARCFRQRRNQCVRENRGRRGLAQCGYYQCLRHWCGNPIPIHC